MHDLFTIAARAVIKRAMPAYVREESILRYFQRRDGGMHQLRFFLRHMHRFRLIELLKLP